MVKNNKYKRQSNPTQRPRSVFLKPLNEVPTEDSDSNMFLEVMLNWESTNKNFTESPAGKKNR